MKLTVTQQDLTINGRRCTAVIPLASVLTDVEGWRVRLVVRPERDEASPGEFLCDAPVVHMDPLTLTYTFEFTQEDVDKISGTEPYVVVYAGVDLKAVASRGNIAVA